MDLDLDLNLKEIQELGTNLNESVKLKYILSSIESKYEMQC